MFMQKNGGWKTLGEREDGSVQWQCGWVGVEKGVVDWAQVLKDLKSVGYDGYIGMEDFSGVHSDKEALQHNIEWFKSLL